MSRGGHHGTTTSCAVRAGRARAETVQPRAGGRGGGGQGEGSALRHGNLDTKGESVNWLEDGVCGKPFFEAYIMYDIKTYLRLVRDSSKHISPQWRIDKSGTLGNK